MYLLVDPYNNEVRFTKPGCSPGSSEESSSGPFGGFFGSMLDWLIKPIKTVVDAVKKVPAEAMKVATIAASATPSQLLSNAKSVTNKSVNPATVAAVTATTAATTAATANVIKQVGGGYITEGIKSIPNPPPMLAFVLGLLFIGGFYMASRKAVAAYTNYQTERPPEPYTNLNEEENVGDTPPRPSESSVF